MNHDEYLNTIIAEELIKRTMDPSTWLKALEETDFSDDGLTQKAYLRLRLAALRDEEDRPLIEAGFSSEVRSAREGNPLAQTLIAEWLYSVDLAYESAVPWFRRAADQGYAAGQSGLGNCYCFGKGVSKDYAEAAKWLILAGKQGDARAQYLLGVMSERGQGVAHDDGESARWNLLAANQGHRHAQYNLAKCYLNGRGVEENVIQGLKWLERAAEQELAEAQYLLGAMYSSGKRITQDKALGLKWMERAAEQGMADAQYLLGAMYAEGTGVAPDQTQAAKWLERAANQDVAEAAFALGIKYVEGNGVAKDLKKAAFWYGLGDVVEKEKAGQPCDENCTWCDKLIWFRVREARFLIPSIWVYVFIKKRLKGRPIINLLVKEAAVVEWIESLSSKADKEFALPGAMSFSGLDHCVEEAVKGGDIVEYFCPSCFASEGKHLRYEQWSSLCASGWKALCSCGHEVVNVVSVHRSPIIPGINAPLPKSR